MYLISKKKKKTSTTNSPLAYSLKTLYHSFLVELWYTFVLEPSSPFLMCVCLLISQNNNNNNNNKKVNSLKGQRGFGI